MNCWQKLVSRCGRAALFAVGFGCGWGTTWAADEIQRRDLPALPRPTPEQVQWQDYEIGVFFHYDLNVFRPGWNHRQYDNFPRPEEFQPTNFNIGQWMEAPKALGAKYAILTATHGSGFMLWQSEAYPFGVRQTSWKEGKGDIVREFVDACRKNGIGPGLYCHMRVNGWWQVDHPGFVGRGKGGDAALQAKYAAAKVRQMEELWGNYGPLAEIWFDGGFADPSSGYEVLPYLQKLQPKAMVMGGGNCPVETVRWIGGESGKTTYPCWATGNGIFDDSLGDPLGTSWCPGEADVDLLGGLWQWQPGSDARIHSLNELMEIYYGSVGNNCNLLINAAPGPDGLVPAAQLARLREFGNEIRRRFGKPLAETSGKGNIVGLKLKGPKIVDHVTLMEQISEGERVRGYVIEGKIDGKWKLIGGGSCIGHKRIERIPPTRVSAVRFRATAGVGVPILRKLAVYNTSVEN
jgi:alpha-L-fucosidase